MRRMMITQENNTEITKEGGCNIVNNSNNSNNNNNHVGRISGREQKGDVVLKFMVKDKEKGQYLER